MIELETADVRERLGAELRKRRWRRIARRAWGEVREWAMAFLILYALWLAACVAQGIADPPPAQDTVEVSR